MGNNVHDIALGVTAQEAFDELDLDWGTKLRAVKYTERDLPDGQKVHIAPTHVVHLRNDNQELLGVVPADYIPIPNMALAQFADELFPGDGAEIVTAGTCRDGRDAFVLLGVPGPCNAHDKYVLVRNSHDGSSDFMVYLTSVRVEDEGTLLISLWDASKGVKVPHTQPDVTAFVTKAQLTLDGFMDVGAYS